jgi:hypothetical protein
VFPKFRPAAFSVRCLFALTLSIVLVACPSPTPSVRDGDEVAEDFDAGVAKSSKAVLRFKGPERLENDFAEALGLSPAKLCAELGLYACTSVVHTVSLGGVEPYASGVYETPPFTGVSGSSAVDRIALSACKQRVDADLSAPGDALIFKDIELNAEGAVRDINSVAVGNALKVLYQRALLRQPRQSEVQLLKALAPEIEALGGPRAGADWMLMTCFAALSSTESIFY